MKHTLIYIHNQNLYLMTNTAASLHSIYVHHVCIYICSYKDKSRIKDKIKTSDSK